MVPGNDEMNYKNFFNKAEEETSVPGFEEVLQFSPGQKKKTPPFLLIAPLVILFGVILFGIYHSRNKPGNAAFIKTEEGLFKQKPLVWEWKSPTSQLLLTPPDEEVLNFELPTDFLSPKNILSKESDIKKQIKLYED